MFKNSFWNNLANKCKFLFNWSLKKQANKKNAISGSVIEKRTQAWIPLLLILPAALVLGFFTILPFFFNLYESITTSVSQEQIEAGIRPNFTFDNISALFQDKYFAVGVRNSFIYGLLILPISMIISILISSLVASLIRKTAKGFWQTIFFLPYVTNAVAVSLAFVQMFEPTGPFNKIFGLNTGWLKPSELKEWGMNSIFVLIINGVWHGLAFNVLLFTTAMLSVDKNLYRSASIDGLPGWKQFFTITLPSIKRTTTFLVTMGIINGIKVFPLALFENNVENARNAGASTIILYIYHFVQSNNYKMAGAASIGLFIIGVSYSTIIRGGFGAIALASFNKGESDVWNKIKNSNEIREFEAQKKKRLSYSTSSR
ncbi:carbohydrate ABC transporter permease [Mycoplasmopsis hyopharyngis]|uniref:carbohydrate ABC transporter permease n=1 Tax=Mycoplasmopsis hyopharyngis TaxID=29558 RepID=UPI0038738BAE